MKTIKGTPNLINGSVLGRTQRSGFSFFGNVVLLGRTSSCLARNTISIVPDNMEMPSNKVYVSISVDDYNSLHEGDIVTIDKDGTIHVVWEETAHDNVLFTTDLCNSLCIMCPQRPDGAANLYYEYCEQILKLVKNTENLETIGITGGEPTMSKDGILKILKLCSEKFYSTPIAMLTNGKNFDDFDFAKECVLSNQNVTYCIPLYAPYSELHDYIVGSQGSFSRTINGIYNLIRLRSRIEIRIVLTKQNVQIVPILADFIYQNMPFVVHIALMGMETTGLAKENLNDVWVDPYEYRDILITTAQFLKRSGLNFSFYNIPRCLLPKRLWGLDRDSISSWKKSYASLCGECVEKENCCGLFETSIKQSSHLKPIKA